MSINAELQKLAPSALIDLYELDVTPNGGGLLRFHSGVNGLGNDIVWQGESYVRMPITIDGFDRRGSGALPRPLARLSNINGLMAAEARQYDYFLGCKFTRRRTFARFLDAVNFADGNPDADPDQEMPLEVWFVDRKSSETPEVLEFELASALDMPGVLLPRRQIVQNSCPWGYRSLDCGYSGPPVAKADDTPTSDPAQDRCSKHLSGCKLRFGENSALPFGGFPAVGLVR